MLTSVVKIGFQGLVLGEYSASTRALAEASWGKSANYSLLGQSRSNSGKSAITRSKNSGLLGQTRDYSVKK